MEEKPQPVKKAQTSDLEETLISVWRQTLIKEQTSVTLSGKSYPVTRTSKLGLREVDFEFEGDTVRGLEQNPETTSQWAELAREGKKVMQFLDLNTGKYIANVADWKLKFYGRNNDNQ